MKWRQGSATENWFEAFFDFLDRRFITRRIMTIGTFVIVGKVIFWSLDYAQSSARNGTDIALILAAITVPLNGLMGYMFGQYVKPTTPATDPAPQVVEASATVSTTPAVAVSSSGKTVG